MYFAGYIVTGFLLAGAYALGVPARAPWPLRADGARHPADDRGLASPLQVLVGDWAARGVAVDQPVKLAAMEGLYTDHPRRAPSTCSAGTRAAVKYGIEIPQLLSLLAFHSPNARVTGLEAVPASQRPPINVVRFAFQTMVGIGTLLALLGLVYLFVRFRRRRLPRSGGSTGRSCWRGPPSVVALIAGWITTEVGRQPWVVYDVMRIAQAVTGASGIPVGYGALRSSTSAVAAAVVWILRRLAGSPLDLPGADAPAGSTLSRLS